MPGEHAGLGICNPGAVSENTREYSFDPMNSQWNQLYGNGHGGLFILAVTSGEQVVWSLCTTCVVRRNK